MVHTVPMNAGVLVFRNAEELDFAGPWEMLNLWARIAGGPERCLIVAESADPVVCANGLSINPHVSFGKCPEARPPVSSRWTRHARTGGQCVSDRLHFQAGRGLPQRAFGMHGSVSAASCGAAFGKEGHHSQELARPVARSGRRDGRRAAVRPGWQDMDGRRGVRRHGPHVGLHRGLLRRRGRRESAVRGRVLPVDYALWQR